MLEALLAASAFLGEHSDIFAEVAKAIAGGTPKEAIKAAIKGVQVADSDAALKEELDAAEARRK